MPVLKPCPRCKKLMQAGPAYCAECAPLARAELEAVREQNRTKRMQKYNRQRDPKYSAFYNSKAWRLTSVRKLQEVNYKCEGRLHRDCQGLACEVHHIKPIQTPEGWELRLEWSNLEALCTVCHNARHPEKFKRMNEDGVVDLRMVER